MDIYRNATGEYADYLLPAAGAFEREDVNFAGIGLQFSPSVQFTEAVVPPQYERRPDWWIYEQLARAMSFSSAFDGLESDALESEQWPDMWGRVDAMLRSRSLSMAQLKKEQIIALERSDPEDFYDRYLQTDDARVNCFPDTLARGIPRMVEIFRELERRPDGALTMISKRDAYMFNSWYANVDKLKQKHRSRNYLFMHPLDAERRQISDGTQVKIASESGSISAPVKLTDDLLEGVVAMTHGWGHCLLYTSPSPRDA